MNWKSYEVFTKGTIRKCKEYLSKITEDKPFGEREAIESYLDELFHWENKLQNGIPDN